MRKIAILFLALTFLVPIFDLKAQEVDLLWQAETYIPPFYKGKALWSNQSRVKLLAIPRGLGVGNPLNLTYKWTKNGTVLGNINGVGKNTIAFTDPAISRPQTIQVDIISADAGKIASATVTLNQSAPVLVAYENNPLYGFMFHKALGEVYDLGNAEATLTAFPFFFTASARTALGLNYEWLTNNSGTAEKANTVTYRAPEDTVGSSEISLRVSNENKLLQSANKNFLIRFGEQEQ